ncbi:zinc finger protein 584 [Ischnura elegans]|uniref:zinc finger protein 584 n=1 Tax=Ischnura elegans TaxID=197161 RepID=UPI001ED88EB6|nr:zinc finger protein 584 [Ischnura elegans]
MSAAALADELLLGRELLARRCLEASSPASWGEAWSPSRTAEPLASLGVCGAEGRTVAAEDIPQEAASEVFSGSAIAAAKGTTTTCIRRRQRADGILIMEPERSTSAPPPSSDTCWIRGMRIAEDCHSCNVRLTEAVGGFVARTTRMVAAGEEMLLWFSPEVLAILKIPFLAPSNIRGEKAYVCNRCGTRFETPNPLKLHLSLDCGRTSGDALWDRLRITCPVAPQPVLPSQLPSLNSIVGSHPSSRNGDGSRGGHLCIYCGKLYSRKYGLKIHIRTHTGYKPLKCKFCLRPFGDPSNLNKHIRLHAEGGDAPYRCMQCGKVLVRRRDLERHIKSRHQHHEEASSSDSDFGSKCLK